MTRIHVDEVLLMTKTDTDLVIICDIILVLKVVFFNFLNISAHFHIYRPKPTKTPPRGPEGERGDTVLQQL